MSYPEKMGSVVDEATQQFAAITLVTDIVPIELVSNVSGAAATFDFLAAVANHIYFVENLSVNETGLVTGQPTIRAYNIAAAAQSIIAPGLVNVPPIISNRFWCTRLEHLLASGTGGTYAILFNGFDLTYT